MENQITVIMYSFNDENQISDAILSSQLITNQILLIDMESTDDTVALAKEKGVKTHLFPHSKYVEPARGFGIEKAQTQWVFILDADERVSKELAQEIKNKIKDTEFSHYKIPRKNIFHKYKWLKHGGWWPDHQIRLISKNHFVAWPVEIHSTPQIKGEMGYLDSPLIHYFHGDIGKMVEKTITFEDIESNLLLKANKNANVFTFARKFFGELYRRMFKGRGFLDGEIGIIESIYQAFSKTITYLFLYEKKKNQPAGRQDRSL